MASDAQQKQKNKYNLGNKQDILLNYEYKSMERKIFVMGKFVITIIIFIKITKRLVSFPFAPKLGKLFLLIFVKTHAI